MGDRAKSIRLGSVQRRCLHTMAASEELGMRACDIAWAAGLDIFERGSAGSALKRMSEHGLVYSVQDPTTVIQGGHLMRRWYLSQSGIALAAERFGVMGKAARQIDHSLTVPDFKPGDLVWTVFPWPQLYDARQGDLSIDGLELCKPVQVCICCRQENRVGPDGQPPWLVQFAEEADGEANFGRFGKPADSTFELPRVHLERDRTAIVERAAAGPQQIRDAMNKLINQLYEELI